nr:hypothetical protein [Tanacetum cinerariifolium]
MTEKGCHKLLRTYRVTNCGGNAGRLNNCGADVVVVTILKWTYRVTNCGGNAGRLNNCGADGRSVHSAEEGDNDMGIDDQPVSTSCDLINRNQWEFMLCLLMNVVNDPGRMNNDGRTVEKLRRKSNTALKEELDQEQLIG